MTELLNLQGRLVPMVDGELVRPQPPSFFATVSFDPLAELPAPPAVPPPASAEEQEQGEQGQEQEQEQEQGFCSSCRQKQTIACEEGQEKEEKSVHAHAQEKGG